MSEKIVWIKGFACAVFGAVGAFISSLYGGFGEDLITLLIFMATDYITGIIVAAFFKKSNKSETGALSSIAGLRGLMKKAVILLAVLIAHRLDISLSKDYIMTATIIAFISNEGISIIENLGLMGVYMPSCVKKAIEILRGSENGDN